MNSRILKQIPIAFLLIALLAVLAACGKDKSDNGGNGSSSEVVSGDFTYFDVGNGICIIDYNGSDSVVHIPEILDGRTVTQLQMNTHDIVREIFIPKTVTVVNGFTNSAGLEIVHWEGVQNTDALYGLTHCYDIKELYLPGMQSIHLCDLQQSFYRQLKVLDISDCYEVTGYMAPASYEDGLSLNVIVNENVRYLYLPENANECVTLSATFQEGCLSITEDSWGESWSYIFFDYAELELNGKTIESDPDQYSVWSQIRWWQVVSPAGDPNGKLFHITENHAYYFGDESTADMKNPDETMNEYYNVDHLFYYGGQLWDLDDGSFYLPMEISEIVTLPDGTQIESYKIYYLDDGAMAIPYQTLPGIWGHKTFFADGTYAISDYSDSSGTVCEYGNSYTIDVSWYDADGYILKEDCLRTSDMFLLRRDEYEYETVTDSEDVVLRYAVATNSSGYDKLNGGYFKWRSEYGPLHGPEKPYKTISYDYETGKVLYWDEHSYDMSGNLKWSKFYNGNDILVQHDGYTNGKITVQYLFDEETGNMTRETLFEDYEKYLRISETQYFSDGGKYTILFKDGKCIQSEWVHSDKSYEITFYDDDENPTIMHFHNKNGTYIGKTIYERIETHGKDREVHYDKNNVLDYIHEYTGNETGEYMITTSYYENGNVHIIRAYDINYNIIREEWYDTDGNMLS